MLRMRMCLGSLSHIVVFDITLVSSAVGFHKIRRSTSTKSIHNLVTWSERPLVFWKWDLAFWGPHRNILLRLSSDRVCLLYPPQLYSCQWLRTYGCWYKWPEEEVTQIHVDAMVVKENFNTVTVATKDTPVHLLQVIYTQRKREERKRFRDNLAQRMWKDYLLFLGINWYLYYRDLLCNLRALHVCVAKMKTSMMFVMGYNIIDLWLERIYIETFLSYQSSLQCWSYLQIF